MKYSITGALNNTSEITKEIKTAIKEFFDLCSVEEIEGTCNNKRLELLTDWGSKPKDDPIMELGIHTITYAIGIKEITNQYKLTKPERLEVIFSDGKSYVNEGNAAMEINIQTNQIYVYKGSFNLRDGGYYWGDMSIKDVLYHELLHACGDVQYDGIIRHNFIGVESIKQLIKEKYEREINKEKH